jgi:hypothetical protein
MTCCKFNILEESRQKWSGGQETKDKDVLPHNG